MKSKVLKNTEDTFLACKTLKSSSYSTMSNALLRSIEQPKTFLPLLRKWSVTDVAAQVHMVVLDLAWNPNCIWSQPSFTIGRAISQMELSHG